MTEKYRDAYGRGDLITPDYARIQLIQLGYIKLSQVPIQQSDYLMTLFTIANSPTPLSLVKVRDAVRANMQGRGGSINNY